jgi:hypothetical protein
VPAKESSFSVESMGARWLSTFEGSLARNERMVLIE